MKRHIESLKFASLVIGASTASSGCSGYRMQRAADAPSAPFSAPPRGLSTICVFRPHGLGTSVIAAVSDNGTIVGATDGSSYFCYHAEPGRHRIRVADAPKLALDVKQAKSYYFAHDLNIGADTLTRITRGSAEALSAFCADVELSEAPEGVAILRRGAVARADRPGTLVAAAAPPDAGAQGAGLVAAKADR
jgi:hypothetical protein